VGPTRARKARRRGSTCGAIVKGDQKEIISGTIDVKSIAVHGGFRN
jgi:hypothetical protein